LELLTDELAGVDDEILWHYYMAIAYESNFYAEKGLDVKENAIASNNYIAKAALETIGNIPKDSTLDRDLLLTHLVVKSFQTISEFPDFIRDDTFDEILTTLEDLFTH
jgi:hypothetical protein